jgi:hypothetical protein
MEEQHDPIILDEYRNPTRRSDDVQIEKIIFDGLITH